MVVQLGLLSATFGSLEGVKVGLRAATFTNERIPLSGPYGIAGRTLVITDAASGAPAVCARVEDTRWRRRAAATLSGAVRGTVTFQQPEDTSLDTTISVDLLVDDGVAGVAGALAWQLQGAAHNCSLSTPLNPLRTCNTTGGACAYDTRCGRGVRQAACQVGDLTAILGIIEFVRPEKLTMELTGVVSSSSRVRYLPV